MTREEAIAWVLDHTDHTIWSTGRTTVRIDGRGEVWVLEPDGADAVRWVPAEREH